MLWVLRFIKLINFLHFFLLNLSSSHSEGFLHLGLLLVFNELSLSFNNHRILDSLEFTHLDDGSILLLAFDCVLSDASKLFGSDHRWSTFRSLC